MYLIMYLVRGLHLTKSMHREEAELSVISMNVSYFIELLKFLLSCSLYFHPVFLWN